MSIDIVYTMYSNKNKILMSFNSYNEAVDFIKKHEVGYTWSYITFLTNKKVTRKLPLFVYIVKEIDTGGGYSRFSNKYWFNVAKTN